MSKCPFGQMAFGSESFLCRQIIPGEWTYSCHHNRPEKASALVKAEVAAANTVDRLLAPSPPLLA